MDNKVSPRWALISALFLLTCAIGIVALVSQRPTGPTKQVGFQAPPVQFKTEKSEAKTTALGRAYKNLQEALAEVLANLRLSK